MSPRPLLLLLALALLPAPAAAQPAMPDPSMMSGIPRPDPKVPAGTITVRLIRGNFANPLTGQGVELWSLPADKEKSPPKTEKTDDAGRATFSGLAPGAYEARATVEDEALASQPIELGAEPGIAVMLVFSKSIADQQKELGKADGKARVSLELPPGVLVVRAVEEGGTALSGLRVSLSHGDRATEKVETLPDQTTNAQGEARFEGLKYGPGDGYLVSVYRDGTACRGKPFRLVDNHGSLLAMQCQKASLDASQLRLGAGSRIILELEDDTVRGMEVLQLKNPLEHPIDPGPGGVRIPLPEGALSPQVVPMQEGQIPTAVIDVSKAGEAVAVWKGQLPPGETMLPVAFLLKHRGTLRFRQAATVGFESLHLIVEKIPGLAVEGQGLESEERSWQGRPLLSVTVPPPSAGGLVEFSVTGLPYQAPVGRYLAAILALVVVTGFGLTLRRGGEAEPSSGRKDALERRRRELLDRIVQLPATGEGTEGGRKDDKKADGKKKKAPDREQLLQELEGVYREIDELGGRG